MKYKTGLNQFQASNLRKSNFDSGTMQYQQYKIAVPVKSLLFPCSVGCPAPIAAEKNEGRC